MIIIDIKLFEMIIILMTLVGLVLGLFVSWPILGTILGFVVGLLVTFGLTTINPDIF